MNKINGNWNFPLIGFGFVLILITSCKKDDTKNNLEIIVTTAAVTEKTKTTARSGGNISSDAGLTITRRGVCWSRDNDTYTTPLDTLDNLTTDSTGTGAYVSLITGLGSGTTYFVRAYAIYYNDADTTKLVKPKYGKVISFKTADEIVYTTAVTSRSQTSATCGGTITSEAGSESTITARGVCWNTEKNPSVANDTTINGAGQGSFTSIMTQLNPDTNYYVRAYAIIGVDVIYGNEIIVRTYKSEVETDSEGNEYNLITIGGQVWMVENLKTTKYFDGRPIPTVKDNVAWGKLPTPGYCWYKNDEVKYKNDYCALYNWYAVNTDSICPKGWRVPDNEDWEKLTAYLGGDQTAGGKLKEPGTSHWLSPNTDATDETGFTGLPGGGRNYLGTFDDLTQNGYWWSSTESTADLAWFRQLNNDDGVIERLSLDKHSGISVRCIKK
jgi:uncharacterized protein (TIGR02145 family)